MLGMRYEEYTTFDGKLPFSLALGITITKERYSSEANWHENLELQLCTEGKGVVLLDGDKYPVRQGDIIVVNSNVIHHMSTSDTVKYDCLIIGSDFCRMADISPDNLRFCPYMRNEEFLSLFEELKSVYADENKLCRVAKLEILILKILIELQEKYTASESTKASALRSFETVRNAIKFIRENYDKKLLLDEIARAVLTDKYTLSKEFKKITGKTVVQYTNSYRCMKAAEYIADGTPVADSARLCGFSNMSFFTKTFKSHMGKLPSKHKSAVIK